MQDRFKFRVWLGFENKMITPENESFFALNQHGSLLKINDKNEVCWARIGHTFADEDIMQCTGLKDKNGKLIYEGDIIKGKKDMICSPHSSRMVYKVGVVEIPQNMFVASCRDVKNNCTLFCQNDWVKTEVIGNVYQNPELLED